MCHHYHFHHCMFAKLICPQPWPCKPSRSRLDLEKAVSSTLHNRQAFTASCSLSAHISTHDIGLLVRSVASVVYHSLRPQGMQLSRLPCPWDFPGKNSGVGFHSLLQAIFPTQRLNPHFLCLLHWQVDSLPLNHWGSPNHLTKTWLKKNELKKKPLCICSQKLLLFVFSYDGYLHYYTYSNNPKGEHEIYVFIKGE